MKNRIYTLIALIFISLCAQAQTPQLINYQAVARNNSGAPIPNQSLGLRLSILDGSPSGTVLYQETQTSPTNQFGLFTLQIGSGTVVSGTFAGINWGANTKYIKVEMDPAGGTNYTVIGASQLMSVPYALYAQTTANPGWSLTGNAGTTSGTNFIGTTDNEPLIFEIDGSQAGRIDLNNTSIGYQAMLANTTGYFNEAIGFYALLSNTTGYANTANGQRALAYNTTGASNTSVGYYALGANTTGSYNTAVGYETFLSGSTLNNSMALGNAASVNSSNQVAIGNTSITSIQGQVAFTTFSDARVKNNVQPNVPGLAFITALRPVTYHYDVKKENELLGIKNDTANWAGKYDIEKMTFSGFIAQEVDATAKQIGYDFSGVDKSGALLGIRYSDFVPSLVKAIQEQQQVITSLQEKIQTMTQAQAETTARLNKLEAAMTK